MELLSKTRLRELEAKLGQLARLQNLGSVEDAWLSQLEALLPPNSISTLDWTIHNRYHKGTNDLAYRTDLGLTPYTARFMELADEAKVRAIMVQGPARGSKTVPAENIALKRWARGPFGDTLWYMQSSDDIDDYMEERGDWMLANHAQVAARIDHSYRRQARDRKKIGDSLARWLPATTKTTRGKAAPLIIADEIDAYPLKIAKAILTLLLNRQNEFGSQALLYLCSHPDLGPAAGIAKLIADSTQHLWWWLCLHCGKPSSPCAEASTRMSWNVPDMLPMLRGVERVDAFEYARVNARLVCPHCRGLIDFKERLVMSRETGAWLQPHQQLVGPRQVEGEAHIDQFMGFVIHAFMAPFFKIDEAAPGWLSAMFTYENNQDEEPLRQVVVKTLGEVMQTAAADQKIDTWQVIRTRMLSGTSYLKRQVPRGVHFLTAFVDIQKRGFEVRVIGWNALTLESWLIDAYLVGQRMELGRAMDKIDPFRNLDDWTVLEDAVLNQVYRLQEDASYVMPIAKMGIDLQGGEETYRNARRWASHVIHRERAPVASWRIGLTRGANTWAGELYGKAKQVEFDDAGQPLAGKIYERSVLVNQLKQIIRRRQNIEQPGPGFMYAPQDLEEQYFRELASERLVGREWIKDGPNETFDAWVNGEVMRESLKADRLEIDWKAAPPSWARPFRPGVDPVPTPAAGRMSVYQRMVALNGER